MEKSGRAFLAVAIGVYLAVVCLLYPLYSPDYFAILGAPNRFLSLIGNELIVGRFVSGLGAYLASLVKLDPFETYPVYVAMTAPMVALFLRRLYLRYLGLEPSLALFSVFAFTFLFSGAMFDVLSFREVPHHALLVFVFGYLYLALEDMREGWPRALLQVAAVVCLFATYQAAAVMIVVLAVLKAMFEAAGGMSVRETGKRLVGDAIIVFAGLVLYMVVKGFVERHFGVEMVRKFLDYRDSAAVARRLDEHARALLALFQTPGEMYQWAHVGAGLVLGLLGYVALAVRAGRRGVLCIILAGCLVLLLQDPLNLVGVDYWPVLRSSFYVALVPGLLLAFVYGRATSALVQRTRGIGLAAVVALYAVAGTLLLTEAYELRERDAALARAIADSVKADLPVGSFRLTANWSRVQAANYAGVDGLRFEFGFPLMTVPWSVSPYLKHVTGVDLKYAGPAQCADVGAPRLSVTAGDGVLDVCF
ncbi:hypothetical protein [Cupriavidus alkaliphilus]|uniref:Uncharacterized protein n=1 Tax=Cupriavidus alkaliphilus TaxID=942866 RepID=A0A7W4YQN0_9BURK|nr:hypothetical protein [Cupriavidus alkaliphilus]MBB3006211.1 hypothetical protein [Cupriavidus alkaliphilus]SCB16515.1 Glucosyl transferase GtrII [Cupriavidus alkaliphilus]